MALGLNIPLIEVNHMQAHVLAHFIDKPVPQFPFLCLTVSGGHTQIVLVRDYLDMEVIGQTQDDAVGEAFDKAAKILEMPYPGGPLIDRHAQSGDAHAFRFPETSMPGLDFSFSGIKTAFLYFIRDEKKKNPDFVSQNLPDICASLQHTLVSMLLSKLEQASIQTGIRDIAIAGGVSANSGLRKSLQLLAERKSWNVFIPAFEYCTDNAAMIAMAAHFKYLSNEFTTMDVVPLARMPV
jgi:N6-L-threonylcarbamoyladenine synthase